MTLILAVKKNDTTEITLEWEKYGVLYARVYENWGGEWHQTHESMPYKEHSKEKAKAAYKRFVKKYI